MFTENAPLGRQQDSTIYKQMTSVTSKALFGSQMLLTLFSTVAIILFLRTKNLCGGRADGWTFLLLSLWLACREAWLILKSIFLRFSF